MSRQRLRSAQQNTLMVPRYRLTTYGRRAFSVAGPTAWNSLPVLFGDPTISDACFRRHLKTVLFAQQRRHHSVKCVRDLFMTTRCINSRSFIHSLSNRSKNVRRILIRGVNAPLPPEAKKILKIWLRNGAFWSTEKCCFCVFSLFNFSSISRGVSWPHLPLCADAHEPK